MNMVEKMQLMMDERSLTKADVARGADLPYATVDNLFKRGFEKTGYPTIRKLATYFDVSMEYLTNEDINDRNYGKVISNNISGDEHRLISLWRQLPRDEQLKMLGRIELTIEFSDMYKEIDH